MSESVVEAVRSAEDTGKKQFQKFHEDRISSSATAFNDTIHKNNLPLLNSGFAKKSKTHSKISNIQNDVNLFSRMYIMSSSGQ